MLMSGLRLSNLNKETIYLLTYLDLFDNNVLLDDTNPIYLTNLPWNSENYIRNVVRLLLSFGKSGSMNLIGRVSYLIYVSIRQEGFNYFR